MQIKVADYSEFIDKVFDATGDTLDVVLSAKEYKNGTFKVACDDNFSQVKLHSEDVALLTDSTVNLCGDSLEVENLIFNSPRISNAVFVARGKKQVKVKNCAWLRSYLEEQQGLSIIHIQPDAATDLTVSDSWIIRNQTSKGHNIWGFRTSSSGNITSMSFTRTAFVDNQADYIIAAITADKIDMLDCFVLLRDDTSVFLGARTKGADIAFTGCTIIAPSFQQVVTQWASDAKDGDFKPAIFTDCHVYLTQDDAIPSSIKLVNTAVKKINSLSDDDVKEWVQSQDTLARSGQAPHSQTLRESLNLK